MAIFLYYITTKKKNHPTLYFANNPPLPPSLPPGTVFSPLPALPFGRASPGEFPWLCRVEDASTGAFVANCAVVPTDLDNDVSSSGATDRVITVAHRIRGRRTRSVMGGGGKVYRITQPNQRRQGVVAFLAAKLNND